MNPSPLLAAGAAFVLSLAAVLPSAVSAQPSGRPGEEPAQVSVAMADLRLDTKAGRKEARARLDRAATLVCGPEPSHLAELQRQAVFQACRRQALQAAEQRLEQSIDVRTAAR